MGVKNLLVPALLVFVAVLLYAARRGHKEVLDRTWAGLWAGVLATLAYDLVRVPVVLAGVPVFKAISYFGTVLVDQEIPGVFSEVVGWSYHLSNGLGFGLMYSAVVSRARLWTAIVWGLSLELAMLVTPYAEIFGYKITSGFLSLTIGAHVVYGTVLWAALRLWQGGATLAVHRRIGLKYLTLLAALLGIGALATDFHRRQAQALPPSPPADLGPHLYTTWNVLEPDRLAALWVKSRFDEKDARFHFIPPFSHFSYGTPFDTPEAEIRRSGAEAATEVLLSKLGLERDKRLVLLARMTHVYEITPWLLPSDREVASFGAALKSATGECGEREVRPGVERAFRFLDDWWYERPID
jgi:hypothetical protein